MSQIGTHNAYWKIFFKNNNTQNIIIETDLLFTLVHENFWPQIKLPPVSFSPSNGVPRNPVWETLL
jgi:hypothetical protein